MLGEGEGRVVPRGQHHPVKQVLNRQDIARMYAHHGAARHAPAVDVDRHIVSEVGVIQHNQSRHNLRDARRDIAIDSKGTIWFTEHYVNKIGAFNPNGV